MAVKVLYEYKNLVVASFIDLCTLLAIALTVTCGLGALVLMELLSPWQAAAVSQEPHSTRLCSPLLEQQRTDLGTVWRVRSALMRSLWLRNLHINTLHDNKTLYVDLWKSWDWNRSASSLLLPWRVTHGHDKFTRNVYNCMMYTNVLRLLDMTVLFTYQLNIEREPEKTEHAPNCLLE